MVGKKLNHEESLKEIKRLMEFHFKPHNRNSVESEPNIVKFNDVGTEHRYSTTDDGYPSFDEYIDEVVNEADPNSKGLAPNAPPSKPKAETTQQTKKEPEQQKPVEPVVAPQPTPVVVKEPESGKYDEVKHLLDRQTAKTEELLAKLDDMESKLSSVEQVNSKIDKLSQEIEEIKPPSYEDQLEMVSKNSYPYNVKLSDYWNFDDEKEEEKPEEFKINPDEIKNYSEADIKKSFAPDLNPDNFKKIR